MTTAQDLIVSVVVVSLLLSLLVGFMISFAFLYQKRRFQYQREKQALREAYDRELLQTQVEIQNQTLQQIGQELHDNVGQLLTLARLHLGSAENLSESPEAAGKVRQANEVLKTTIQAVRALSKTLDADTVAQHGLVESLRLECDRISRLGTVAVRFESTRLPDELPPQAQLVVFRMAQEVLNNALKHADAQTLTVTMTLLEGRLLLDLADDGQGFSPDEAAARSLDAGGSGLRNLRRRAELLGGTFALTSQPGQGTQVRIAVPVT